VDDSPFVVPRVKVLMNDWTETIIIGESRNAEEANLLIDHAMPDIVLLDLELQETNGLTLLNEIKQKYPDMIVIIFTNNSDPYVRNIAREYGADYFIDKSFEFELLPFVIRVLYEQIPFLFIPKTSSHPMAG
jgi:DNA-binding NarL/FixJ family response regulator